MTKTQDEIIITDTSNLDKTIGENWTRQLATARAAWERWREGLDIVLIADGVGMGKTYAALAAMAEYIFQTGNVNDRKALLVVPSAVLATKWRQDILTFDHRYVRRDHGRNKKRLRPLVIADHWDMLACLHDFADVEKARENDFRVKCFARLFMDWRNNIVRAPNKGKKKWPLCLDVEEDDPRFFHFCSQFSPNIVNTFLSEWRSDAAGANEELFRLLDEASKPRRGVNAEKSAMEPLGDLFRRFARAQDAYEPNIYILAMTTLRREPRNSGKNTKLLNTYLARHICLNLGEANQRKAFDRLTGTESGFNFEGKGQWQRNGFDQLKDVSLWGLKDVVRKLIESHRREYQDTILKGSNNDINSLLARLRGDVFKRKLEQSGIELAIVDEAHNWKNGNNGAKTFAALYAPSIPRKLLLSATPFQVNERELEKVFELASGTQAEENPSRSLEIVKNFLNDSAIACIEASDHFLAAWNQLLEPEARQLALLFPETEENGVFVDTRLALTGIVGDHCCSDLLREFARRALEYRQALDDAQKEMRKVILRQPKDNRLRHFHAGREFAPEGDPNYEAIRRTLHRTVGYGDDENCFVNFVGMRAMQMAQAAVGDRVNARLLGGITSSHSAFREGAGMAKLKKEPAVKGRAQDYFDLFMRILAESPHPKVTATVQRAMANYEQGRKTLIFCERIPTLKELSAKLEEMLAARLGDLMTLRKTRETILRDHRRMELYLSRSLLAALGAQSSPELPDQKGMEQIIADAIAKAKATPAVVRSSERQQLKILDLNILAGLANHSRKAIKTERLTETAAWIGGFPEYDKYLNRYLYIRRAHPNGNVEERAIDPDETEDVAIANVEGQTNWFDLARVILHGENIWYVAEKLGDLHTAIWEILSSELENLEKDVSNDSRNEILAQLLLDLPQGLRRVLLRLDRLRDLLSDHDGTDPAAAILNGLRRHAGDRQGGWQRTAEFLALLADSEGSIRRGDVRASRRQSLWRGIRVRANSGEPVATLDGSTPNQTRTNMCAAFNSPLAPDILICTSVGAEGIDLHLYCADVIHHDLPWNPAKLEQRTGRIDRVGSMVERTNDLQKLRVNVGIPFLAYDYEQFQYDLLQNRDQKQMVLLGKPEFLYAPIEEDIDLDRVSLVDSIVRESEEDAVELTLRESNRQAIAIPTRIVEYLQMDLSC